MTQLFKALGDPSRVRIIFQIFLSDACVKDIAEKLQMSEPAVSHHLRVLRSAGIITLRKAGKESYYSLADTAEGRLVHKIIDDLFDFKCRR